MIRLPLPLSGNAFFSHSLHDSNNTKKNRLPGFGQRLADKLEEIVTTHRLRRLDEAAADETTKVRAVLENIYGVGSHTSLLWYKQGVRTLDDARKRPDLSPVQKIGLDHYDDFLKPIPRAETRRHFETVQAEVSKLDPAAECICMGSYRRGRPENGDIDIIITKSAEGTGIEELRRLLLRAVVVLFRMGFLRCALAGPDPRHYDWDISRMEQEYNYPSNRPSAAGSRKSRSASSSSSAAKTHLQPITKWYGASVLEDVGIYRRIDFLIVPPAELGASLLYFTGNDLFNRSIRLLAQKKGYRLNQHGLFKNVVRVNRFKTTQGELVEGADERRIFEILGVPWREPKDRSVM